MSSNFYTIQDEDGDFEDWIEIFNTSDSFINLENYTLSDNNQNIDKWTFPPFLLGPNEYLFIFASGKDRLSGTNLHTNFKISSTGETIILANSFGQIIDEYPAIELLVDQSFGRINNGMYPLLLFETPTPGFQNADDYYYPSSIKPIFSHTSGFYNNPFSLELQRENDLFTIRYTFNGKEPTINDLEYTNPLIINDESIPFLSYLPTTSKSAKDWFTWKVPSVNIDMATVLKARYFYNDIPVGNASAATFFIGEKFQNYKLPIFSIIADRDGFYDYERGIYVGGRIGDEEEVDWNWGTGNFHQRGREWERKVNVSFFENKHLVFSQDAGVRIHGGGSRALPIKSLRLYARSAYGTPTFNYPFFPDLDIQNYDRILLRNSGQDFNDTYIKDALTHELIKHLDIEIQHYQPSILFLNGEFWGIHNIRERIDERYLKYRKNASDIDLIENFIYAPIGSKSHYDYFLETLLNHDIKTEEAFNYFSENVDVQNYIDYMIAKIYFGVYDFPGNNLQMWREKKTTSKYRFIFYDNDDAFEDYKFNALKHATYEQGSDWPNPPHSTILFRTILKNGQFKNIFLERFEYHLYHTFNEDRVVNHCVDLKNQISPYIKNHIQRWRYPKDLNHWNSKITEIYEFAAKRPCYLKKQLFDFFDIKDINYLGNIATDCSSNAFSDLLIYPNPVSEIFTIRFVVKESISNPINIDIVSSNGKKVYSREKEVFKGLNFQEIKIDKQLAKGLYFIHISNSRKNTISGKILKMEF